MTKEKKLTAAQRVEALEKAIVDLGETSDAQTQNIEFLAKQMDGLKQTIGALARRLNATIKSGEAGGVSNETVTKLLVEENVQELKDKVEYLKEQGVLEDTKDTTIGDRSFIIGRELDEDSNVINPRMQFALASLTAEAKEKVSGKKSGDVIKDFSGDGLVLEITEVYAIAAEKEQKKDFEESKEA